MQNNVNFNSLEGRIDLKIMPDSAHNCFLLQGVQEVTQEKKEERENCINTAVALFRDKLKVPIDVRCLNRVHHIGTPRSKPNDKPRPIIVKKEVTLLLCMWRAWMNNLLKKRNMDLHLQEVRALGDLAKSLCRNISFLMA
ncbi:hypothetical protein J437_LFUL017814 [Ladona fulva]|uniref:Uncharacterized protein n=1 Tax=Ladona fulva TaxID=123851 RepID=A0A8K0P6X4_LADFU|nr:hypothetical protein J437_LFUL017814 [Ladona fulva]